MDEDEVLEAVRILKAEGHDTSTTSIAEHLRADEADVEAALEALHGRHVLYKLVTWWAVGPTPTPDENSDSYRQYQP